MFYVPPKRTIFPQCRREAVLGTFSPRNLSRPSIRLMVQQSKVGITRSAVDGALVLEYEDMFTGKRSKLSRSQRLCLGRIEIPKVRRFPSILAPQIGPISDFDQ